MHKYFENSFLNRCWRCLKKSSDTFNILGILNNSSIPLLGLITFLVGVKDDQISWYWEKTFTPSVNVNGHKETAKLLC